MGNRKLYNTFKTPFTQKRDCPRFTLHNRITILEKIFVDLRVLVPFLFTKSETKLFHYHEEVNVQEIFKSPPVNCQYFKNIFKGPPVNCQNFHIIKLALYNNFEKLSEKREVFSKSYFKVGKIKFPRMAKWHFQRPVSCKENPKCTRDLFSLEHIRYNIKGKYLKFMICKIISN